MRANVAAALTLPAAGNSISPLTYQRQHPSTGRRPSALRHSTTAGGERSVSRKGLSSPQANGLGSSAAKSRASTRRRLSSVELEANEESYTQEEVDYADQDEEQYDDERGEEEEDNDEDEEEEVRAALGANKTGGSAKSSRNTGRRSSFEDQREPSVDVEDSPSGLMKLDRNGRPVPADRLKQKGKGRASDFPSSPARGAEVVRQETVEQYAEQDYYQDDFGGGGSEYGGEGDGGDGGYDALDYGDGGGGGDDYDSGDGGAGHDDVDVQEVDDEGNAVSEDDGQMQGPSSRPYKGKGKGKGRPSSNRRTSDSQSVSPQRQGASSKQASRRRQPSQSQKPVVTEISRKRTREMGTVDIDGGERSFSVRASLFGETDAAP